MQEEKTFSIFIQTDYILNETSNIARTEKKTNRFTTEYITSSNVCICKCAFARVFFCKGYKCVSLTSSKCIHEVTWSCEVKLIWGYMCNCGTKSLVEGGKIQISKYFFSWSVVPFLLYPTYRSNIVGCGKKYKYISCYISIILSNLYYKLQYLV